MKYNKIIIALAITMATGFLSQQAMAAPAIETFYNNAQASHTKHMHNVFTNLSEGNYDKAYVEMQTLERMIASNKTAYEASLYPLYDLAYAMFLSRPQLGNVNIPIDSWRAIQLVRNVYVRQTAINEANSFLGADDISLSIDMIKNMVEKKLVADAKKVQNEEAYQQLLSVLDPDSEAFKEAENQLSILEFEFNCTTAKGCRNFLRNYPNSPLVNKVKEKLIKYDFANAQEVNDEPTWKKFVTDYQLIPGSSEYISYANSKLKELADRALLTQQPQEETAQEEQPQAQETPKAEKKPAVANQKFNVTLATLDEYATKNKREAVNPVFVVYDNLINLPMSSYRMLSLKMAFNGYVGRVDETVKESTGNTFSNRFIFNEQGLLTEAYNGHTKVTTRYTYSYDNNHGFLPKTKTENGKEYTFSATYDKNGRLATLKCTDGTVYTFNFDEMGKIVSRTDKKADKHVESTYKSGRIRTEKSAKSTLKFLKYDGYKATEIQSVSGETTHTWNYAFTVNAKNFWTKAEANLNGKPRLTITRKYTK